MQYSPSSSSIPTQFKQSAANLVEAIRRKDPATAAHVERTARFALRIARELTDSNGAHGIPRLDPVMIERVWWAAVLHDVGKIEVEQAILLKPGALEPGELDEMREHPRLGFRLLGGVSEVGEVAEAALHHHERWDGQGYPDGLKGRQIPWIARLIAVADAYDAMVSERPYRAGMSPIEAYEEILSLSGTQFDPTMVAAFARAFRESTGLAERLAMAPSGQS